MSDVILLVITCGVCSPFIYFCIRELRKDRERTRREEERRARALLEWELGRAVYGLRNPLVSRIDTQKILAAIKKRRKGR